VVIGFALAIVLAERSADHVVWGGLLGGALAVACGGAARRWRAARGALLAAAGALVLGYPYTLWSSLYLPETHLARHLHPTPVTLEGRLLRLVRISDRRTALDVAAQGLRDATGERRVSGLVRVTAYDFAPAAAAGDVVRLHQLRLRRPSGFRNPGAFDYPGYLARRGIHVVASLSKAERLEVVQRAPEGLLTGLSRLKAALLAPVAALPEPLAAITQAMVWGTQSAQLPPDVREAFIASGTAHLMSVSGLHVGFVYAAVFLVLRAGLAFLRFRLLTRLSGGPRPSKLAAAAGLLAVIVYAALVGANVPTLRATLMLATFVGAYLLDRDGDPCNTLALAALLILLLQPLSLFDVGFQLSFAGVLAILAAQRRLAPAPDASEIQAQPRWGARLRARAREFVVVSVCASLGTAPLILYYFQRLPLIAAPANVFVVPLASVAVPVALLASVAAQAWQGLGDLLLALTGGLVTVLYGLIRLFAAPSFAAPRLGPVSLPVVVLAYAGLALLWYGRGRRAARYGVVAIGLVVSAWLAWPWLLPAGRGELRATFLDVGHGDACLIRFPRGTTMLVDGGGSYRDDVDIGERVVAPFLWHARVRRLDYVVATHPHPDHAKGLRFLLEHFPVRHFWDNGAPLRSPWYAELRREAEARGIYGDVVAEEPSGLTLDGVRLEVLHPTTTYRPSRPRRSSGAEDPEENQRSLVLKLTYGEVSFLLTGDIEQDAEAFLVGSGRDLRATVLKVPHHGSRTSSSEAFVRAVGPRLAVFSVPRDSRFGHPHPAVLARYRALGAQILRTDEHGAITVRTDGRAVWVEPYVGGSLSTPVAHRSAESLPPPAGAPQP
jgi:competence protein ComEC